MYEQIIEIINKGGGVFMIPIVLASIISLTIIIERAVYWFYKLTVRDSYLCLHLLTTDDEEVLLQGKNSRDLVAQVIYQYRTFNLEMAQHHAKIGLLESRRYLPTLRLVANLATSLGLLGTVVGVAISFESMAMTDSSGVAKGLSTALYTTIAGLIVFLFASLALHLYQGLAQGLTKKVEDTLVKLHYGKKNSSLKNPSPKNGSPPSVPKEIALDRVPYRESQPVMVMEADYVRAELQKQLQAHKAELSRQLAQDLTPRVQEISPSVQTRSESSRLRETQKSKSPSGRFSAPPRIAPDSNTRSQPGGFSAVPRIAPDGEEASPSQESKSARRKTSLTLAAQLDQLEDLEGGSVKKK